MKICERAEKKFLPVMFRNLSAKSSWSSCLHCEMIVFQKPMNFRCWKSKCGREGDERSRKMFLPSMGMLLSLGLSQ